MKGGYGLCRKDSVKKVTERKKKVIYTKKEKIMTSEVRVEVQSEQKGIGEIKFKTRLALYERRS